MVLSIYIYIYKYIYIQLLVDRVNYGPFFIFFQFAPGNSKSSANLHSWKISSFKRSQVPPCAGCQGVTPFAWFLLFHPGKSWHQEAGRMLVIFPHWGVCSAVWKRRFWGPVAPTHPPKHLNIRVLVPQFLGTWNDLGDLDGRFNRLIERFRSKGSLEGFFGYRRLKGLGYFIHI